jgi:hypothetical protein
LKAKAEKSRKLILKRIVEKVEYYKCEQKWTKKYLKWNKMDGNFIAAPCTFS